MTWVETPDLNSMLRILFISLCLLISGCTGINEYFRTSVPEIPPTPLTEIKASIEVEQVWQRNIGSGSPISRIKLHPAFAGDLVFAADPEGSIMLAFLGKNSSQP